jgi:SAM-dependent methyltransferase
MSYYDRIADAWDKLTGDEGGPFKRHVLNDRLLGLLPDVGDRVVVELGAGTGYFARLLCRRRPGRLPRRLVVTDASGELLRIARERHAAPGAEILPLDLSSPFPFGKGEVDLLLATMVFNELPTPVLRSALGECARVLRPGGQLLATVLHPLFIDSLDRRGEIKAQKGNRRRLTMPGSDGLRLPVVPRAAAEYETLLRSASFTFASHDVEPDEKVLAAKPGARKMGRIPWALVFDARTPGGL